MANLIRSAKSGSDWTRIDLLAYNIRISTVDTEEFFGVPHLPATMVDPIILNHVNAPVGLHLPRDVRLFFHHLHDVITRDTTVHEAFVIDFSLHLLGNLLYFDEPDRVMHQQVDLPFIMSGQQVYARPDIALRDSKNHILLVQEDKVSFPLLP